jgi:hypothetical protein
MSLQLVLSQEGLSRVRAFDVIQEGKPACAIVIAENPGPSARLAALELQSHVLKISGAEIPIRSERQPAEGRRILVGPGKQ